MKLLIKEITQPLSEGSSSDFESGYSQAIVDAEGILEDALRFGEVLDRNFINSFISTLEDRRSNELMEVTTMTNGKNFSYGDKVYHKRLKQKGTFLIYRPNGTDAVVDFINAQGYVETAEVPVSELMVYQPNKHFD